MMTKRSSTGVAILGLMILAICPATPSDFENLFVPKSIVIVKSTRSYADAKRTAELAASRLHWKLDLRGLLESKPSGLTLSPSECERNGYSYPCYVARGRYDDGLYVSIEHSNAYQGFKKGLYIVVVASGIPEDPAIASALTQVKVAYGDAYSKLTKVFVGCMH